MTRSRRANRALPERIAKEDRESASTSHHHGEPDSPDGEARARDVDRLRIAGDRRVTDVDDLGRPRHPSSVSESKARLGTSLTMPRSAALTRMQ